MPRGLQRFHSGGDAHFITCSCYDRQPFLSSARRRDLFLTILEEVMPEHFHLLISEPAKRTVATVMQVLKQRVSRRCRGKKKSSHQIALWEQEAPRAFWQRRYYDFNVFSERKHVEKLRYMHRNPVKRQLVASAELWRWSSFRSYWLGEDGTVRIGPSIPPFAAQGVGHPLYSEG
jgi:putative transposase